MQTEKRTEEAITSSIQKKISREEVITVDRFCVRG